LHSIGIILVLVSSLVPYIEASNRDYLILAIKLLSNILPIFILN